MPRTSKKRDPLPDASASLEEVAEFWDSHDTTDYEDAFVTVDADFEIHRRHFQVEVKEDVFQAVRECSESRHVSIGDVIDEILRKNLIPST